MTDVLKVTLENGVPVAGDGEVDTITAAMRDGGLTTIGHRADAASLATGGEAPATLMQAMKQVSRSLQNICAKLPAALGSGGGLKIDSSGELVHMDWITGQGPVRLKQGYIASSLFISGTDIIGSGCLHGPPGGNATMPFYDITDGPGVIEIVRTTLRINRSALISGEGGYNLQFYSAPPPSAFMTGTTLNIAVVDRPYYLGYAPLGTPVDMGSTLIAEAIPHKFIKLTGRNMFCYLNNYGGVSYTPTAVEYCVTIETKRV